MEDRWTRHRPGAGLLLLLVLAAALAWPLWRWRGLSHPMAASARVELCAWLANVPPLDQVPRASRATPGSAGTCRWAFADGALVLEASLLTTRAASSGGPARLDRFYDTWRDEVRASGAEDLAERGEPGARVLRYRLGNQRQRLLEDHGVLLSLRSEVLDDVRLDALGAPLLAALRAARPPPPPRKPLLEKAAELELQTR